MGKLKFLGACRIVGGSGILVESGTRQIILDYGIYLRKENPFPITISPKYIDGIFLTHAHLDHSGSLPLMYITGNPPLYSTKMTSELIEILLNDYINVSETPLPFEEEEILRIKENTVSVDYGDEVIFDDNLKVKIYDAGHIPGSMMVLLEINNKKILYTGDVNLNDTMLLKGATLELPEVDYVITESTYALTEHPPREELEKKFIQSILEVLENDGVVLIPAFAVSRSQEILCILRKYDIDFPIVLDGMARRVSKVFLKNPKFFRDFELLKEAHRDVEIIRNKRQREKIVNQNCIVVSPAGMLSGGAALYYASQIFKDPKNAIFIVGYQVPGSPGRVLLEQNKLLLNGGAYEVSSQVEYFDFSSHCGSEELIRLIKNIPGNPKVITIHGEEESCAFLAERVKNELGLE
ncbi:MAG: MBL fold metallo-hydrolase, partial [Candidatus Odinarchaeia archaeon]